MSVEKFLVDAFPEERQMFDELLGPLEYSAAIIQKTFRNFLKGAVALAFLRHELATEMPKDNDEVGCRAMADLLSETTRLLLRHVIESDPLHVCHIARLVDAKMIPAEKLEWMRAQVKLDRERGDSSEE